MSIFKSIIQYSDSRGNPQTRTASFSAHSKGEAEARAIQSTNHLRKNGSVKIHTYER